MRLKLRKPSSTQVSRILGITGELLITFGVIVLMFLAWQLWINSAVVAQQQGKIVAQNSKEWHSNAGTPAPGASKKPDEPAAAAPVFAGVTGSKIIGNLYIPRLGEASTRAVANGVDGPGNLNKGFYGRYPDSQWPGENGNFAVAVHRNGWGTGFTNSPTLRVGDKMYLETAEGYYIYTIRNQEYVLPTGVEVINPIPGSNAEAVTGQSLMTITTCNPNMGDGERLIFYGVLTGWRPAADGAPAEIASMVKGNV